MARGKWSFLQEWALYEYLWDRYQEKTLRLRKVVEKGKLVLREKWVAVRHLKPIRGTSFPDISEIGFKRGGPYPPAEIKFTTSIFNYHNEKDSERYTGFLNQGGFILVLKHDYLPKGLEKDPIDVYEMDKEDFVSYCRENFIRLLNQQIHAHTDTKVWVMYQGPNFNKRTQDIKPARESQIWCPTDNLTGFDLMQGDRVLFVKTSGHPTQRVQRAYRNNDKIISGWLLRELWVGEVTSVIYSRSEYCQAKKLDYDTQLWKNDPKKTEWRWNRVFEFRRIKTIKKSFEMEELFSNKAVKPFVLATLETFCYGASREIKLEEYRDLLEYIG